MLLDCFKKSPILGKNVHLSRSIQDAYYVLLTEQSNGKLEDKHHGNENFSLLVFHLIFFLDICAFNKHNRTFLNENGSISFLFKICMLFNFVEFCRQ